MIMKLCLLLIFASSYASSQACVMPSEIPDSIQSSIFTQRLWDEYRRNQTRQIRAHGGCLNSPVKGPCQVEYRRKIRVPGACLFPFYRPTCYAVGTLSNGERIVKRYRNHSTCIDVRDNTNRLLPEENRGVLTDEEVRKLIERAKATANSTRPTPCSFEVQLMVREDGECIVIRSKLLRSYFHQTLYGCRSIDNAEKVNLFARECRHLKRKHRAH